MVQDSPEHYALVCFGDDGARTMFCDEPFSGQIPVAPTTQEGRQHLFGRLMQRDLENESGGFEIQNGYLQQKAEHQLPTPLFISIKDGGC